MLPVVGPRDAELELALRFNDAVDDGRNRRTQGWRSASSSGQKDLVDGFWWNSAWAGSRRWTDSKRK